MDLPGDPRDGCAVTQILRLARRTSLLLLLACVPRAGAMPPPAGTVRGVVIDGETHLPVDQAMVRLVEMRRAVATDGRGMFAIPDVEPGSITLEASRIGYRTTTITVRAGSDGGEFYLHLFPVPISASGVVVTGEHPSSHIDELLDAGSVLRGKDLQRDMGQTVAATLKNETGLAIRSMGPAPARPVIRGLGGDRILIAEDGTKTGDLSGTSPDHAVTVEPFTAERIEVIRGPRVLLRSPTTIGGVVNIIREDVPSSAPAQVTGSAGFFGETANGGTQAAVAATVPLDQLAVHGEYSTKSSGDVRTPAGTLRNSFARSVTYAGGASLSAGCGFAGAAVRGYDADYGIPGGFVGAHPNGVTIAMLRRVLTARGRWDIHDAVVDALSADVSRTYYRHKEFEYGGLLGAEFRTTTWAARLEAEHRPLGPFTSGTWGVSGEVRDFVVGGFVFTPASRSLNISAFAFEQFTAGPVEAQASLRGAFDRITPEEEDPDARIGHIRTRTFGTVAASVSALLPLEEGFSVGANLSRSARVPTIEELFSEGPHLAAYSYEVGNPDLGLEQGIGAEAFAFYRTAPLSLRLTIFRNSLSSYIISRNTGEINFTTLLPVYAATGVRAVLQGVETQLEWKPLPEILAAVTVSWTRGGITGDGTPLPGIPPLKALLEVKYASSVFTAGVSLEVAAAQHRTDTFEQPTAGYGVTGLFTQIILPSGPLIHHLTLAVDNVFDREYRNHLSRVKSIVPEAGRNLRGVYRLFF